MDLEKLKNFLKNVLVKFINNDLFLLENDSHEQSISHKIACYLENELNDFLNENNYSVDVEYNKYGEDPKRNKELDNSLIRPDIVIHRRGKNNNGDNLLIFEIKKDSLDTNDFKKLQEMTKNNGEFKYKYGIGLYNFNVSNKSCIIDIYENGEKIENIIFINGNIINA